MKEQIQKGEKLSPASLVPQVVNTVLLLMEDSRRRELRRLQQYEEKDQHFQLGGYLKTRLKDLEKSTNELYREEDTMNDIMCRCGCLKVVHSYEEGKCLNCGKNCHLWEKLGHEPPIRKGK